MAKREAFLLRVEKGRLVPVDEATRERMRAKGYHVGDVLSAQLRKARNPGYHRLAHALGRLVAENIEGFEGLPAHDVLKRLQLEADAGCRRLHILMPGVGPVEYRIPESLSFENMDDGEFTDVFDAIKKHVVKRYWPTLTEDRIHQMAELMG